MTAQPSLAQDALLLSVGVKGLTHTHSWMNAKCRSVVCHWFSVVIHAITWHWLSM